MEHTTLLTTPMNKLGLGTRFNSHFFYPKRDIMKQEEVLTLGEFLKLNTQPLVGKELWKEAKEKKIYQGVNGRSIRSFKGIYMVEIINNKVTDFKII